MSSVFREQLLTPGPIDIPAQVQQAMSRPVSYHRGEEFGAVFQECLALSRQVLGTSKDVLILPGTGRGGIEAAIVNVLSPGEKVLVVCNGVFGELQASIATTFGAEAVRLDTDWSRAVPVDAVADALRRDPSIRAVLVTHCESATGVLNDIRTLGEVVRQTDSLLIVDAVSSLGGAPLKFDEWGLDVVVSASQKALMGAPGLTLLCLSDRAWARASSARMPRAFWDVQKAREFLARRPYPQTPQTTPVTLVYGLREGLRHIVEEGLENVWARHRQIAELTWRGLEALGLRLFVPDPAHRSPTVTAVVSPPAIDAKAVVRLMRETFGVRIGGGLRKMESTTFRIGHMGAVHMREIISVMAFLSLTLRWLGYEPSALGAELARWVPAPGDMTSPR